MVLLGRLDERRVDIHPYHHVAQPVQRATDPPWSAPGIEDPRASGEHGVGKAGFTVEVRSLAGH